MSLSHKTRLAACKAYSSLGIGNITNFIYKLYDLSQPKIYGSSRFMRNHEMLELMNPGTNKGLCFSPYYRLPLKDSFTGTAMFTPTGFGKTTRFHIPNILENNGSMIVIDAFNKEEESIYHRTSGAKAAQGCKIKSLFLDRPAESNRFNHLRYCLTPDHSKEIAGFLAKTMAGQSPIWHNKAADIIHFFQRVLFKNQDKELMNCFNVGWLVKNFSGNEEGVREFMFKTIHPSLNPKDEELNDLWASYLSFAKLTPETLQGILTTAAGALSPWDSMSNNISQITAEDAMELDKLREEKTVIYLRFKKTQLPKYGLFLNLFLTTCMRVLADQEYKEGMAPVFLFLDEFGNLPPIANFETLASTLRDSDVSVNITAQSVSQLTKQYGQDVTDTILENLTSKLYLGGLHTPTTKMLSETLGEKTLQEVVSPQTEREKNRTITAGNKLMPANKIRELKKGAGIGVFSNHKPIFFKRLKGYYEYPHLNKLSLLTPFKAHFPPVGKLKRVPLTMTAEFPDTARRPPEHKLSRHKPQKNKKSVTQTIPELNSSFSRSVNSALGLA